MAYDDGRVACTEEALVIRSYYFPPHDKRIPYGAIERVHRVPAAVVGGQIWGSSDFIHWFNFSCGTMIVNTFGTHTMFRLHGEGFSFLLGRDGPSPVPR